MRTQDEKLISLIKIKIPNSDYYHEIEKLIATEQRFKAFELIDRLKSDGAIILTIKEEEILKEFWFSIY